MPTRKQLPLVWGIDTRDGTMSKDSKVGNMVLTMTSSGPTLQKRPGLDIWYSYGPGPAQGVFSYIGVLCYIIGGMVYQVVSARGATPPTGSAIPGPPTAGVLYDALPAFDNATTAPAFKSTDGGYTYSGGAVTVIPGFPAGTCAGLAFLDGTYYVMSQSTIYASAYGDYTTWPGLNTVNTDAAYGNGVAIAAHTAYLVVLMESGTQFFYDAGISPGAPIAQVSNGAVGVGCANGRSVVSFEDTLYFLARDIDGSLCVGQFTALTFQRISTPAIEKILAQSNLAEPIPRYGLPLAPPTVLASCGVVLGKPVYLLTLTSYGVLGGITLCYDITDSLWTYWTTGAGAFQGVYLTGGSASFYSTLNSSFAVGLTNGAVCTLSEGYYQDFTDVAITCFIRTPPTDEGTYAVKFVAGAYLHSDTISTTVSVTYSNDDYQTFAVPRTIDLSTQKKQMVRGGSYRHRSWDLTHTDITDFRVRALEIEYTPVGEDNE